MTHLLEAPCRECGAMTLADPSQLANVMCGPCRLADASVRATIPTLPAETPPSIYRVPSRLRGPENGVQRAESIPPEYVCPPARKGGCEHTPPRPVSDLCDLAWGSGWHREYRHSRGGVVGGTGKQLAVKDLWSVRFRRDGWMGYAVRRGDEWSSICIAGAELPPFLGCGLAELKDWLADPAVGGCLDQWVADIRARKAEQVAAQKERTKAAAATRGTKRIDHAD